MIVPRRVIVRMSRIVVIVPRRVVKKSRIVVIVPRRVRVVRKY